MDALLSQIQSLLSSQSGILAYHLVLSFCIVGGLHLSLTQQAGYVSSKHRRLLFGLISLLSIRLSLFIIHALVWQGFIPAKEHLPVIDRALTLLTIVLLLWLWLFPERSKFGDTATFVMVTLLLLVTTFDVLWRNTGRLSQSDYLLQSDVLSQWIALFLLTIGLIFIMLRQPLLWVQGTLMLFLLLLGHGLYLFIMPFYEDYPVVIRLFQLIAFPFLFTLPARLSVEPALMIKGLSGEEMGERQLPKGMRLNWENPQVWEAVNKLLSTQEPASLCTAVCSILARIAEADICLIVTTDAEAKQLHLDCGVDLTLNRTLEARSLDLRSVPLIASSYRLGRTRRIQGNSTSPDLTNLAKAVNLERTGNVLFIPVLSSIAKTKQGVLLLAPYSSRDWSVDEQSLLRAFARLLVHFLHRSNEVSGLNMEIERLTKSIQELSHKEAQERITVPLSESSFESVEGIVEEPGKERVSPSAVPSTSNVDGELILALEEIAYLRSAMEEAETKLHTLRRTLAQSEGSAQSEGRAVLTSVAAELRQQLANVKGYTEVLLSETYGILGERQKRSLERIRLSVERMEKAIEDLTHTQAHPAEYEILAPEEIELLSFVESLVQEFCLKTQDTERIHMHFPEGSVTIWAEKPALATVINGLLENACLVSGAQGEVHLSLSLDHKELGEDYVLLQIQDSGEGIDAEQLAMVFSTRSSQLQLPGLGIALSRLLDIKQTVERQGGRIWVDSTPSVGTTFSLLFPVKQFR